MAIKIEHIFGTLRKVKNSKSAEAEGRGVANSGAERRGEKCGRTFQTIIERRIEISRVILRIYRAVRWSGENGYFSERNVFWIFRFVGLSEVSMCLGDFVELLMRLGEFSGC